MFREELIRLDLFNRMGCNEIFELRIGSSEGRFRRHGVARELVKHCLQLAREIGVLNVKSEPTSLYSQRGLQNGGFETLSEIKYADLRMANGSMMFAVQAPHDSVKFMIKKLEPILNE